MVQRQDKEFPHSAPGQVFHLTAELFWYIWNTVPAEHPERKRKESTEKEISIIFFSSELIYSKVTKGINAIAVGMRKDHGRRIKNYLD